MAMFGGFFGVFRKKIETVTFPADVIETLLPN